MDLISVAILSLIEGVTEFLPISSTGHLVLTSYILKLNQTEFLKSFQIIIQLGAILGVVILYYKDLLNKKLWPQILLAFVPSMIVGGLFYSFIKGVLIGNPYVTVSALFLGGLAFLAFEYFKKGETITDTPVEKISYKNSLIIGLFQAFSVIPGVSRAGATILGALLVGIDRQNAAKFSFLLAVPTIAGATALDIFETKLAFDPTEISFLILGFILSFIVATITVKLFIKYLSNHNYVFFGIYRIVLSIAYYLLFLR